MLAVIVIIPYFHCKIINLHRFQCKKFILYNDFDVNFTLDFFVFSCSQKILRKLQKIVNPAGLSKFGLFQNIFTKPNRFKI
nr:MAG TPA: hypothetical protein [Caudoviricetes sp.]